MMGKDGRSVPPRLDDLRCEDWRALNVDELQGLARENLLDKACKVDGVMLARLLGERDRLRCALEAAEWLVEEMTNAGFIDGERPVDTLNLDPLERAIYCLRLAIASTR